MRGMIVAPQPAAVEAGASVLMQGGNAVDAAVTCAFVQGIVDPHSCGIGGYALLNAHLAGQTSPNRLLDGPALAGSKATPGMWADRVIGPNPDGWGFFLKEKVNDTGYASICTPGTVKALAAMLERWGTISWPQAIEPAARLADEGFVISSHLDAGWQAKAGYPEACAPIDYVRSNPEASRLYLKADGTPYKAGETLRNPDYARTLRQLAGQGSDDFYRGDLARRMADDLAAQGSFVTALDLADYELRDGLPVTGTYRGCTISTSPPPHGGPTLLAILNILEGYDLAALGHNSPEYIYRVAMAMKAAFADRNQHLGDPRFVGYPPKGGWMPLEWMTGKARAAEWRRGIDAGESISVSYTPSGSPDTTHVTVVDAAGNAVALTHSLGASSGVITPGLGFMYNNSMINFYPYPGHPNSIAPRKGRTTGMAPTLVYQNERPVLVLGSPGATRIITANLQVILNVLEFGMSVSDAVLAPRFDCQGDLIRCHARIPEYICAEVRCRHAIERLPQSHGGLALVHAITIDPETGRLAGAADPGSGGMALEV
jgi:gamma-glutamyltranspeptidase/glutathione hydrolase